MTTPNPDLAQAWSDGFAAGFESGQARLHWQLTDRDQRGPIPQQPANPYPVTQTAVNCAVAAQMFEQHKGR